MTIRRVAGETPDFRNKQINEWAKAFTRFGQVKRWTPVFTPQLFTIIGSFQLNHAQYVRLGEIVFFYIDVEFSVNGGAGQVLNFTLPTSVTPLFGPDFIGSIPPVLGACRCQSAGAGMQMSHFSVPLTGTSMDAYAVPGPSVTFPWTPGAGSVSGIGMYRV